jgi:hypothetical protein
MYPSDTTRKAYLITMLCTILIFTIELIQMYLGTVTSNTWIALTAATLLCMIHMHIVWLHMIPMHERIMITRGNLKLLLYAMTIISITLPAANAAAYIITTY